MKILFTTLIIGYPPKGGPQLRIQNSIKAISKSNEVYLLIRQPYGRNDNRIINRYYLAFCKKVLYCRSFFLFPHNRYLQLLRRAKSILFFEEARYISYIADTYGIQVVWISFTSISFPLILELKLIRHDLKIICDTESVWSQFILRRLPHISSPIKKLATFIKGSIKQIEERIFANLGNIVLAVSSKEAQYYASLTRNKKKIFILSNVIDPKNYNIKGANLTSKATIILSGTFGTNSPMNHAAEWFCKNVFPIVRNTRPSAKCIIVGVDAASVLSGISGYKKGVVIKSDVDSMLPFLHRATVAVVPLHFESGTRFKILEAGICKVPVISTTLGAEGLGVRHKRDILIADDPKIFAQHVITLLENQKLRKRLAEALYKKVRMQYSIATSVHQVQHIIQYLKSL